MKLVLTVALLAGILAASAEISHENQFKPENVKVWAAVGVETRGDYRALEGDHTRSASLHIRAYAENEKQRLLWFTVIAQDDLFVKPSQSVHPKFAETRTKGTWKAHDKVEYLRFVTIEGTKGVIFKDRFFKKVEKR
jgi:hypothetical protein